MSPTCKADGCTRAPDAKGLCCAHYQRWARHGHVRADVAIRAASPRTEPGAPCKADGCERDAAARGFCNAHFQRWLRDGDPRADVPIRDVKRSESLACWVDGCESPGACRGLCARHYARDRKYGDPLEGGALRGGRREKRGCSIQDCPRPHYALGLCQRHRCRLMRYGDPTFDPRNRNKVCEAEGCTATRQCSARWCPKHHNRFQKYGDPGVTRNAPPGSGALTDGGYRMIQCTGHPNANPWGRILEHRLVMSRIIGRPLLANENVHHRNGDRLDNRPENLELWVKSQPCGQRIEDVVAHAEEILRVYEPLVDAMDSE